MVLVRMEVEMGILYPFLKLNIMTELLVMYHYLTTKIRMGLNLHLGVDSGSSY